MRKAYWHWFLEKLFEYGPQTKATKISKLDGSQTWSHFWTLEKTVNCLEKETYRIEDMHLKRGEHSEDRSVSNNSRTKPSKLWKQQGRVTKAKDCSSRGSEKIVSQKKTSKMPTGLKIGTILVIIKDMCIKHSVKSHMY